MKLFFGLNPTPNQINDLNLKAGSPKAISNDTPNQPPRTPRPSAFKPTQPHTSQPQTNGGGTPLSSNHNTRNSNGISQNSVPSTPPTPSTAPSTPMQTATAPAPQPPPSPAQTATSPSPAPVQTTPAPQPSPSTAQAEPNSSSVHSDVSTPKTNPSNMKPHNATEVPQENPELVKMRQEMERMREELQRLKQTEGNSGTIPTINETKTAESQEPPPLPKNVTTSTAIPAVPVDSANDGSTIQLQAYSGKTMTITGDTIVNFTNTRGLNGDDFQFLDHNEQYRISRQGTKWIITPGMNTRNATMLNYLPLTGPEVLENDDTISISIPGSNVHKMTLTVKILS